MKKVFVALSGGVDSSVVAHKLQNDGWDVTAVFIRVWQPDFIPCTQNEEERAAMRVAAHLGIPFRRLDLSAEYKRDVVDTMISEYRAGRTPNPDVLCNTSIKFGAFLKYAQKNGVTTIATGHHARVEQENGMFNLLRGRDASKDQAYFLWTLSQEELHHTLMPVGTMTKAEVREYANEHNLPSAYKPDSQGLCFIGHVDMKTFLKHFITTKPGDVIDEEGHVVGTHDGAELMTLGQRGGFTITEKNAHRDIYYVVGKDLEKNTITVSPHIDTSSQANTTFALTNTNIISKPLSEKSYTCEIRYHGEPIPCTITQNEGEYSVVTLTHPVLVAPGQSIVFYDGNLCLGGGIVV